MNETGLSVTVINSLFVHWQRHARLVGKLSGLWNITCGGIFTVKKRHVVDMCIEHCVLCGSGCVTDVY